MFTVLVGTDSAQQASIFMSQIWRKDEKVLTEWRVFPLTEKEKKLNLMQSFSEEIDGEEIVVSLTACWSLTAAAGVPEPEYSMRKRCGSEWARDFSSLSLSLYTATDSRSFLHFRLHLTYNWGRKLSFHPPRPWQGNAKCNALGYNRSRGINYSEILS